MLRRRGKFNPGLRKENLPALTRMGVDETLRKLEIGCVWIWGRTGRSQSQDTGKGGIWTAFASARVK